MKIYVSAQAWRDGNGTKERPFKHIQDAAEIAQPGDEVLVGPGVYREYVDPVNAGTPEAPITYRSVEPLGAVITGAEDVYKRQPHRLWYNRRSTQGCPQGGGDPAHRGSPSLPLWRTL